MQSLPPRKFILPRGKRHLNKRFYEMPSSIGLAERVWQKIYKNGKNINQPWRGSKITADGDCSQQIKRLLLLGRKAVANLDSVFKSRDITLPTKIHIVKATVFPIVMYVCESWTIKKAEHWRTDAFKLWCWRRLLSIPWTARRSNQSILKESTLNIHWLEWCGSWSSNILATWLEQPTHWKRSWCWERLKAGGEGDDRGWDGWMASPARWTWIWSSSGRQWRTGKPGML